MYGRKVRLLMRHSLVAILILLSLSIPPALAQVEADFSTGGGIRVGDSATACSASIEGAIRYDSDGGKIVEYCDGTAWSAVGGGGTPAGADREIQFNSGGAFATDANFVFTSAGLLGLGTTSPLAELDINKGHILSTGGSIHHLFNNYWDAAQSRFEYAGYDGGSKYAAMTSFNPNTGGLGFHTTGAAGAAGAEVTSYNWQQLYLHPDGNVGIGTAAPATRLEVKGALKIAYDEQSCAAASEGAIRYDSSSDSFEVCATAGSWSGLGAIEQVSGLSAPSYGLSCTQRTATTSTEATTIACNAGEIMTGGGCRHSSTTVTMEDSGPSAAATWSCEWNSAAATGTAYAICCSY